MSSKKVIFLVSYLKFFKKCYNMIIGGKYEEY